MTQHFGFEHIFSMGVSLLLSANWFFKRAAMFTGVLNLVPRKRFILTLILLLLISGVVLFLRPVSTISTLPQRTNLVAFTGKLWTTPITGSYGLYLLDADSGHVWRWQEKLESADGIAWSSRQQKMVVKGNYEGDFGVYFLFPEGNVSRAPLPQERSFHTPAWSPDGNLIAFSYQGDIHIQNMFSGERYQASSLPTTEFFPSWSPDGTEIVFDAYNSQTDTYAIYRAKSDGTSLTLVVNNGAMPAWSPSGSEIAFSYVQPGQSRSLAIVDPNGSNLRIIVPAPEKDQVDAGIESFVWSPSGDSLIFSSGHDGLCWIDAGFHRLCNKQIYRIGKDGTGMMRLARHSLLQTHFAWINGAASVSSEK
jgi:dipeptidyl aminopeptidase/acylaminoacyl peptidase